MSSDNNSEYIGNDEDPDDVRNRMLQQSTYYLSQLSGDTKFYNDQFSDILDIFYQISIDLDEGMLREMLEDINFEYSADEILSAINPMKKFIDRRANFDYENPEQKASLLILVDIYTKLITHFPELIPVKWIHINHFNN